MSSRSVDILPLEHPFSKESPFCLDGQIQQIGDHIVSGGAFSNVWLGEMSESRLVAIKALRAFNLDKNPKAVQKLIQRTWREFSAWSSLSHPNIMPFIGFSYDFAPSPLLPAPALISPWMNNGTLSSYLEKNPTINRFPLILGITQGLRYLHNRTPAIVHGDLRAGNILIGNDGDARITDFGLSRTIGDTMKLTTTAGSAGSLRWMAPEQFAGEKATTASDIWTYAMTVLETFTDSPPYSHIKVDPQVIASICKGIVPLRPHVEVYPQYSDAIWDICTRCWSVDPTKRPSMDEVEEKLSLTSATPDVRTSHPAEALSGEADNSKTSCQTLDFEFLLASGSSGESHATPEKQLPLVPGESCTTIPDDSSHAPFSSDLLSPSPTSRSSTSPPFLSNESHFSEPASNLYTETKLTRKHGIRRQKALEWETEMQRESKFGMRRLQGEMELDRHGKENSRTPEHRTDRDNYRDKTKWIWPRIFGIRRKKENFASAGEVGQMIRYFTTNSSEDWDIASEICELASLNERMATEAATVLRRELKYADPRAQLSAARLWGIMLHNCSILFLSAASNQKFLITLEKAISSNNTPPVVKERLLDVLGAAAYTYPGVPEAGYRSLWRKVKPPGKPDEGLPLEDEAMLNRPPRYIFSPSSDQSSNLGVLSKEEDMQKLLEECKNGKDNVQLLNQLLTFARPGDLSEPVIRGFYQRCCESHAHIMTRIPWVTAQAEGIRHELHQVYAENPAGAQLHISISNEEGLLDALLEVNQELVDVIRGYEDLERMGISERRETEQPTEVMLGRSRTQWIKEEASFDVMAPFTEEEFSSEGEFSSDENTQGEELLSISHVSLITITDMVH